MNAKQPVLPMLLLCCTQSCSLSVTPSDIVYDPIVRAAFEDEKLTDMFGKPVSHPEDGASCGGSGFSLPPGTIDRGVDWNNATYSPPSIEGTYSLAPCFVRTSEKRAEIGCLDPGELTFSNQVEGHVHLSSRAGEEDCFLSGFGVDNYTLVVCKTTLLLNGCKQPAIDLLYISKAVFGKARPRHRQASRFTVPLDSTCSVPKWTCTSAELSPKTP